MPNDFIDGDEFDPEYLYGKEKYEQEQKTRSEDDVRAMLRRRRSAYVSLFRTGKPSEGDMEIVLNDLAWFCKEFTATYDPTEGSTATERMLVKEGRREVFQRIKDFANLDEDVLLLKYHKPNY